MVLELFLVNHPLDCPICDKGGECELQDYSMAYARPTSDVADPKLPKPKAVDLGPTIVLDEERCIVCQRCVRFDDIIADERQLVVKDRGARDIIATATGTPYRHNFTGNVTELCPVGALTSKSYRFKSRPWDLNRTQTTCTQCAVGCQLQADVRYGTLLRTMSVEEDDAISDGWLCDRGRYNIGFYDAPERLVQPLYRKNGKLVQIGWDDAGIIWAKAIREAIAAHGPSSVGAIGGGRLTNEEAYLLQYVFRAAGVSNLDWRAGTQRQATPGAAGAAIERLDGVGAVVVAGASPAERAPVLWLRVLKAVRRGAKLIEAPTAHEARAAAGDAAPVALIWDGVDLEVGRRYAQAFAGVAGLCAYIASEQANARGAEAMGMLPGSGPGFTSAGKGLDGSAMFDAARGGNLAVLSLLGVNPARNAGDPGAVAQALARVPFLVVSELFATESTQHATLVLPARGPFEKHGTTLGLGGELLPVNASLESPEFVRSDLEMLLGLADQLSIDVPDANEVHREVVRHVAAVPDVTLGDARFAFADEGRGVAVSPKRTILSGGGTWQHDARLAGMRA
jgi:NADH-quinone oxidoreductase subunit G